MTIWASRKTETPIFDDGLNYVGLLNKLPSTKDRGHENVRSRQLTTLQDARLARSRLV
jgi:hypothetical protein